MCWRSFYQSNISPEKKKYALDMTEIYKPKSLNKLCTNSWAEYKKIQWYNIATIYDTLNKDFTSENINLAFLL